MRHIGWLIHIFVGVVIVVGGLSANSFLNEYSGLLTVLGIGFGYYSFVLNLYYNRNPRVYGLVNRLLLRIMRDHTYWELSIAFAFESRTPEERLRLLRELDHVLRNSDFGNVQVSQTTGEHMDVLIENEIGLAFRLESCRLAVNLDRRLTVPVHSYLEYQKHLLDIAEVIQKVVKADEISCDVQVYFRKGRPNPFYGFFVNRVPARLLEAFHVAFKMERYPECRIEASTDHVGVHANNLRKMFDGLDEVLSFSSLPACVEVE